jgi:outer membrane receptor protein involved in Fe transport
MAVTTKSLLLASAASALVLAVVQPVAAQEARQSSASEQEGASAVDDIVVTARRRPETLISVPVVVNVISAETLDNNRADDLSRIGELTPTVVVGAYKSNGGGSIGIRGISSPANQTGFEQAVSVAIDGVQTSDGRITQFGFLDLRQVEVLKGPQALFFGKNSPGGVISIKSADPTDEFEAQLRAGYEFVGDEALVEGYVSGPLNDIFGARLALRYRNLDGWLRNTAQPIANPFYSAATGAPAAAAQLPGALDSRPGEEEFLGRLTLTADFSPNFTARLKVLAGRNEDAGPGVATQNIGPCSGPSPRVAGIVDPFAECVADRNTTVGDLPDAIARTIRGYRGNNRSFGELNVRTAVLDLDWTFGDLTLSSTTGYNWTEYEFLSGLDQTTFSQLAFYNRQTSEEISQEFRLASDFEGPLNFMVGAYFQQTDLFTTNDTKIRDAFFNAAANRYVTYEDLAQQDGDTVSVFGQALWDITETLELSGGLRWTRETKDFAKSNLYGVGTFNTAATLYPGSTTPGLLAGAFEDENVSPEVSLTWRPDGNRTFFLAYKTGYKSGGFGLTSPLQTGTRIGDVDFDSESAEGFEIGAKGVFADGRLRLNAAAFAFDFEDLQVNIFDPARIAFTINNAGTLEQRGFELDGTYQVTDDFSLRGAIAFVDAQYTDFIGQCYSYTFPTGATRATATPPPGCSFVNATALTLQQDFEGRTPARSPEWAGSAGFTWEVPVGPYNLGVTGDAFYSGEYFASDALAPSTLQEAFWRLNLAVALTPPEDDWRVQLIGRNLTDEYYISYAADRTGGTGVPGAIGEQRGVVARGREVALQFTKTF